MAGTLGAIVVRTGEKKKSNKEYVLSNNHVARERRAVAVRQRDFSAGIVG